MLSGCWCGSWRTGHASDYEVNTQSRRGTFVTKSDSTVGRRTLPALAIALLTVLSSPSAWADSSFGGLVGRAPPGLTVSVTNRATGVTRVTTVSKQGRYSVLGLPAGEYVVKASNGASAVVSIAVASTATLNLATAAMISPANALREMSKSLQEVLVTGNRVMNFQDPEVGQIVTLHDIDTLPELDDNFLNFADLTPGVQVMNTSGGLSLRGGANAPEGADIMIDGVSNKDYVTGNLSGGGELNGVADRGNPFPEAAIAEYKVLSSNYSAQYTDATSVIIDAQSASGSNTLKGSASVDFTNQNMRDVTPLETSTGLASPKAQDRTEDYALSAGGPIIRDELHWFVAFQRKDYLIGGVVAPSEGPSITGAAAPTIQQFESFLPQSLTSLWGPESLPFTENLMFGELDAEPTGSDRIEATAQIRSENQTTGGTSLGSAITGSTLARNAAAPVSSGDIRWATDWVHGGTRWTNDLKAYVDHDYQSAAKPQDDISQINYAYVGDGTFYNPLLTTGAQSGYRANQSELGLTDDFTLPNLEWQGTHTFKAGLRVQDLTLQSQMQFASTTASFAWAANTTGLAPNPDNVILSGPIPGLGCGSCASVSSSDRQYGVYLQDDWDINRHLSVDLGARWDYEVVPAYLDWATPQPIVASFQQTFPGSSETYAQALALGGVNISDYISNGHNRSPQTNEIQPRLGFTYDIKGDDEYVLYGGYGRSYDRGAFGTYASEMQSYATYGNNLSVFFPDPPGYTLEGVSSDCPAPTANFNGAPCVAWNPAYLTKPSLLVPYLNASDISSYGNILSSNHLRDPYTDQFSLGLRTRQGEWVMSGTVVYQQSFDIFSDTPGNRNPDGTFENPLLPGIGTTPFFEHGVLESVELQQNDGRNESTQLELSLVKPYTKHSGWSASLAYTYSMAWQNGTFSYWPSAPATSSPASLGYGASATGHEVMLPSASVPRHLIVATYGHDLPWNMYVSFKMTLETPTPIYDTCYPSFDPACPKTTSYSDSSVIVAHLPELFMYKDVDMVLMKTFDLSHGIKPYVRLDIINLLDDTNYDPAYVTSVNETTGVASNANNTALLGSTLTAKLTAGVSW
jgi:hypothetical protein